MGVLTRGDQRRRWILLAAALGLAMATVIFVPIGTSRAEVTVADSAGVLLLGVDSAAEEVRVEYYPDADPDRLDDPLGDPQLPAQTFTIDKRCKLVPNGGPSYLIISPSGGADVSAVGNGLGVRTKNNCSTAQGRIGDGQSLTFTLSRSGGLENAFIMSVEVDVEGKFGADLEYQLDGVGDFLEKDLPNTTDNGADAGIRDNSAALISPSDYFSSITFQASSGSEVAIEGGGDGAVPRDELRADLGVYETVFELVEVREYDADGLECGQSRDEVTAGSNDGPAESFLLQRGTDRPVDEGKGTACLPIAYSLRNTGGEDPFVLFDANLDDAPTAHFVLRIDWEDPVDFVNGEFDPPVREINYDPVADPGFYEPVQACVGLVPDPGGPDDNPDPDPNDVYEHPSWPLSDPLGRTGEVPWCLAGERLVLLETGEWQQIQWYDGEGPDPRFR